MSSLHLWCATRAAAPWRPLPSTERGREAPLLTLPERTAVLGSRWFAALPAELRHDVLHHCTVRRLAHGAAVHADGEARTRLCAVASGALRVCANRPAAPTLEYLPAGDWFVDPAMFGGREPQHAMQAHGRTTVVSVPAELLSLLASRHRGLQPALLQLNHDRMAALFEMLDELSNLPLPARLARCLLRLCARFGQADDASAPYRLQPGLPMRTVSIAGPTGCGRPAPSARIRIALPLKQDELAELIRVSRQRVNLQLKTLEAQGVLQVGRELVVADVAALRRWGGDCGAAHGRPAP